MKIELSGLVIKEFSFGENNKYITILTSERGIITAFVNGSKSLKGKNLAGCSLFAYSDFILYLNKSGFTVNEAVTSKIFFNLKNDLIIFSLAGYFCEAACTLLPEKKHAKDFLRVFLNCIYFLEQKNKNIFLLKSIFELRVCSAAGLMPNLICCKNCEVYESEKMYFIVNEGILNCSRCVGRKSLDSILLDENLLYALRHIVYSPIEKLFSLNLTKKLFLKLSKITQNYILIHSGQNFKSLEIFKDNVDIVM